MPKAGWLWVGVALLSMMPSSRAQVCAVTESYVAAPKAPMAGAKAMTMLAVGTSIMWADGVLPEHTFRHLVADWVANETGRPVELTTFAHSGALLSDAGAGGAANPALALGDLNSSVPTVNQQVDCASEVAGLKEARLILVEGCINDVGAERIVYPWTETLELKTDTDRHCGPEMEVALKKIREKFVAATVVVVGYYPLVSERSSVFGFSGTRRLAKRATKVYVGKHPAIRSARQKQKARGEEHDIMTVNSEEFYQHSKDAIRHAVEDTNGTGQAKAFFAMLPEISRGAGVPTVDPRFAYGAPLRHEWMIPVRFLFFFAFYKDEKYWPRQKLCDTYVRDLLPRFECQASSSFHPNVEGSKSYATSIMRVIPAPIVSGWKAE